MATPLEAVDASAVDPWEVLSGAWRMTGRELAGEADAEGEEAAEIVKGPLFADYELVINLRLLPGAAPDGGWGLYPARTASGAGPLLALVRCGQNIVGRG